MHTYIPWPSMKILLWQKTLYLAICDLSFFVFFAFFPQALEIILFGCGYIAFHLICSVEVALYESANIITCMHTHEYIHTCVDFSQVHLSTLKVAFTPSISSKILCTSLLSRKSSPLLSGDLKVGARDPGFWMRCNGEGWAELRQREGVGKI